MIVLTKADAKAFQCYEALTTPKSIVDTYTKTPVFSTGSELENFDFSSNENITNTHKRREVLSFLAKNKLILQTGFSSNLRLQCSSTCYAFAAFNVLENELVKNDYIERGSIISTPSLLTKVARMRLDNGQEYTDIPTLMSFGTDEVFRAIKDQAIHYFTTDEINRLKNAPGIKNYNSPTEYFLALQEHFFNYQSALFDSYNADSQQLPFNETLLGDRPIDNFINFVKAWTQVKLKYKSTKPLYLKYKFSVLDKQKTFTDSFTEVLDNTAKLQTSSDYINSVRMRSYHDFRNNIFSEFEEVLNNDSYIWIAFDERLFSENHAMTLTNSVYLESGELVGFIYQNSVLTAGEKRNDVIGFIGLKQVEKYMIQYKVILDISTKK